MATAPGIEDLTDILRGVKADVTGEQQQQLDDLTTFTAEEITMFEAENFIRELTHFTLDNYGNAAWLEQHRRIERLNHKAHAQAKDRSDEFVVDALQLDEKALPALIYDLVLSEMWEERIYPLILPNICTLSSLRNYVPLYHQASVANLLEVALFHSASCEAAGDALVDLVDWCVRRLRHLLATPNDDLFTVITNVRDHAAKSDEALLEDQRRDLDFQIALGALNILRFLSDHRRELPLTVTSRLLDTHDVLMLMVPLMEKAPWVRLLQPLELNKEAEAEVEAAHTPPAPREARLQVYSGNEWTDVAEEEVGKLPHFHSQIWFIIFNLMMDNEVRKRYELTSNRSSTLLRLRRYLNEVVFDQIPPLTELLRTLEEISIGGQFGVAAGDKASFIKPLCIELCAAFRESLLKEYEGRWTEVATRALQTVFVPETAEELRKMADIVALPPQALDPKCAGCGADADVRCSRCRGEWYCGRDCQVKRWPDHKAACAAACEAAEK